MANLQTPVSSSASRSIYIDQLSDGTAYLGLAKPGADPTKAIWQIRKLNLTGTQTQILWANGTDAFTNIWNNRASLSYS